MVEQGDGKVQTGIVNVVDGFRFFFHLLLSSAF